MCITYNFLTNFWFYMQYRIYFILILYNTCYLDQCENPITIINFLSKIYNWNANAYMLWLYSIGFLVNVSFFSKMNNKNKINCINLLYVILIKFYLLPSSGKLLYLFYFNANKFSSHIYYFFNSEFNCR